MSKRLDFTNVFKTKNESLRKRILNTYELNKQDKRDILNNINKQGNGNENNNKLKYSYISFENYNDENSGCFSSLMYCMLKCNINNKIIYTTATFFQELEPSMIKAAAVVLDMSVSVDGVEHIKTYKDLLIQGCNESDSNFTFNDFIFITEEEFYNTNV